MKIFYVKKPENKEKLQLYLYSKGYKWASGEHEKVLYCNNNYLHIYILSPNGKFGYGSFTSIKEVLSYLARSTTYNTDEVFCYEENIAPKRKELVIE